MPKAYREPCHLSALRLVAAGQSQKKFQSKSARQSALSCVSWVGVKKAFKILLLDLPRIEYFGGEKRRSRDR